MAATNRAGQGGDRVGAAPRLGDPVLDAAAGLFDRLGWQRTSLEQVAAAAEVPLQGVMRRFPTRDHLAAAILDRVLDGMLEELSNEIEANAPLADRLLAMITRELTLLGPHKAFVRQAMGRLVNPFTPAAALQAPLAARFIGYATEQIDEARDRGEIASWVIPSIAATAFWGLHLRVLVQWFGDAQPRAEATLAASDRWIRAFVRTLGGRDAARPTPARPDPDEHTGELVVFEAAARTTASRAFVVTNDLDERIDTTISATPFVAPSGEEIDLEFTFEPAEVQLGPGENAVVRASVTIPARMAQDVDYRGRIEVDALPDASIAAVLRRHAAEDAAPHAPRKRVKSTKKAK